MSHANSDEVLSVIRPASKGTLLTSGNVAYLELSEENKRLKAVLAATQELLASHNINDPTNSPEDLNPETPKEVSDSEPTSTWCEIKTHPEGEGGSADSEVIHNAAGVEPGEINLPRSLPEGDKQATNHVELEDDRQSLQVRHWRHTLQKTFLNPKNLPKAEDMPKMDQLFTTLEEYDEMTVEQLKFSKIGKVMRHIAALGEHDLNSTPPQDEEFKFRARAKALVQKWRKICDTHVDLLSNANANDNVNAYSASSPPSNSNPTAASSPQAEVEDPGKPDAGDEEAKSALTEDVDAAQVQDIDDFVFVTSEEATDSGSPGGEVLAALRAHQDVDGPAVLQA